MHTSATTVRRKSDYLRWIDMVVIFSYFLSDAMNTSPAGIAPGHVKAFLPLYHILINVIAAPTKDA